MMLERMILHFIGNGAGIKRADVEPFTDLLRLNRRTCYAEKHGCYLCLARKFPRGTRFNGIAITRNRKMY